MLQPINQKLFRIRIQDPVDYAERKIITEGHVPTTLAKISQKPVGYAENKITTEGHAPHLLAENKLFKMSVPVTQPLKIMKKSLANRVVFSDPRVTQSVPPEFADLDVVEYAERGFLGHFGSLGQELFKN